MIYGVSSSVSSLLYCRGGEGTADLDIHYSRLQYSYQYLPPDAVQNVPTNAVQNVPTKFILSTSTSTGTTELQRLRFTASCIRGGLHTGLDSTSTVGLWMVLTFDIDMDALD